MSIIEIINKIEADKKRQNIYPSHAMYMEVLREASLIYPACVVQIVNDEISELIRLNQIAVGETINDQYIKVL